MPTPPRKPIDGRKMPAVIVEARESGHPAAIALQGGDARRRLDHVAAETILQKVAAGMTVKQASADTGVAPGTVHVRAVHDPEFRELLTDARATGAHTLAETVLEVAMDPEISAARASVIIDALKWTAKMANRHVYGDKLAIDARQIVVNLPPEADGI